MFHRGTEISIGSGLGLYIALETAVTLGARIQVSSKVMDNTVFTIEIPNLNITD
jgi:signal transduction histidine kinase